jgi:hypothetical protein
MRKTEIKKLNQIHRIKMADIEDLSKNKKYREGYKHGFNFCRRKVRKTLGLDNDKPLTDN